MRLLNICVVVLLVLAAAYVYEIKFETTLQAARVAEMRSEIRRERYAIAALRAQWARLENPARLQGLVRRHLPLQPPEPTQFISLDRLPEKVPFAPADNSAHAEAGVATEDIPTGSVAGEAEAR